MDKISELSKPVATFTESKPPNPLNAYQLTWHGPKNPEIPYHMYSQEYVSALLSQIEADMEIKARLCRESNSLHDGLKAAEKRIAELEGKLATPVRLPGMADVGMIPALKGTNGETALITRNGVISLCADAIRAAGFTVEGG